MLRIFAGTVLKGINYAGRVAPTTTTLRLPIVASTSMQKCMFSSLQVSPSSRQLPRLLQTTASASNNGAQQQLPVAVQTQPSRNVTKFSLNKGKRKSVKAVIKRFRRLDWGAWIRTYTGRQKKLFKKSAARKRRLRQHVFTNSTQSFLLDKMVTSFWRRPKNWVDDLYAPYHRRDEFFATKGKTFKV